MSWEGTLQSFPLCLADSCKGGGKEGRKGKIRKVRMKEGRRKGRRRMKEERMERKKEWTEGRRKKDRQTIATKRVKGFAREKREENES